MRDAPAASYCIAAEEFWKAGDGNGAQLERGVLHGEAWRKARRQSRGLGSLVYWEMRRISPTPPSTLTFMVMGEVP